MFRRVRRPQDMEEETFLLAQRTWLLLGGLGRLSHQRLLEARSYMVERTPYRTFVFLLTLFALCALSSSHLRLGREPLQPLPPLPQPLAFFLPGRSVERPTCSNFTRSFVAQERPRLRQTLFLRQVGADGLGVGLSSWEWALKAFDLCEHYIHVGKGRRAGLRRHLGALPSTTDYSTLEAQLFGTHIIPAKQLLPVLQHVRETLELQRPLPRHRTW